MNVWGMSDRGIVRSENQDMFLVDVLHDQNQAVIAVCDGMGGANAGSLASEVAINTFAEELKNSLKPEMSVTYMKNIAIAAVTEANKRVYEKSNESASFSGMGTTLVGAVVDGNKAVIVNVGDSRAYLVNRENIMKISKDHSLVEEMLSRGDITEEQARVHPNKNLITRALGAEPSIRVDSFVVTLKNNQYLLLCSDGLTNMLSDQEIKQEILNGGLPEKCCERLVKSAVEHGGMDNISVILLLL